jgi:hypothetical protein
MFRYRQSIVHPNNPSYPQPEYPDSIWKRSWVSGKHPVSKDTVKEWGRNYARTSGALFGWYAPLFYFGPYFDEVQADLNGLHLSRFNLARPHGAGTRQFRICSR